MKKLILFVGISLMCSGCLYTNDKLAIVQKKYPNAIWNNAGCTFLAKDSLNRLICITDSTPNSPNKFTVQSTIIIH